MPIKQTDEKRKTKQQNTPLVSSCFNPAEFIAEE